MLHMQQELRQHVSLQEAGCDSNKTSLARSAAEKLVKVALQRGTADNVTALVMLPHWTKQ